MKMKKFINDPENLTPELLEGFAEAHKDLVRLGDERMVINRKLDEADRVTIVTQGGSGHEPAISGFVGEGMVDISVVGDVFAAPGPKACVDAIKMADKGKGVLYIVLNHAGDMLTGNMTMKKCAKEGLNVVKVVTQEDIANAPRSNADDRRGLVGCIPTYKIAGAAAAEGRSLEEVAAVAQRFADNMATLAVAVNGATHPATGSLLADLGEDEMEIGMGQHGEGGGGRHGENYAGRPAGGSGYQGRREDHADLKRHGSHHTDGAVHRLPQVRFLSEREEYRDRGQLCGRAFDGSGAGRFPDVYGENGRRAAALLERALQHALHEEIIRGGK